MQKHRNEKNIFPDYFINKKVLDVGNVDINGTLRPLFSGCEYLGIDVAAGKGVDLVCKGEEYDGPDNTFDTVVSGEVMEHNPYWAEKMRNMIRVCKPGGLVVMTCAGLGRGSMGLQERQMAYFFQLKLDGTTIEI